MPHNRGTRHKPKYVGLASYKGRTKWVGRAELENTQPDPLTGAAGSSSKRPSPLELPTPSHRELRRTWATKVVQDNAELLGHAAIGRWWTVQWTQVALRGAASSGLMRTVRVRTDRSVSPRSRPGAPKTRNLRAFSERGTEESNLALRFWRPPCYRYTSPPVHFRMRLCFRC
jgi:hypothetical protein